MSSNYTLFYMPTCPYCMKVLHFMKRAHIEVPLANILTDAHAREELVRVGGKLQVPCLFIDGAPLYESDDIIAYLDTHL